VKQTAPIIIKKKKGGDHGGHHGGSWKVAYADFVTAMMAFFMVMWIIGLSDETKAQIQGYFNDPMAFMKNVPTSRTIIRMPSMAAPGSGMGDKRDAAEKEDAQSLNDVKKEIKKDLDQNNSNRPETKQLMKNIEMTITNEGLRIEFMDSKKDAFFQLGSAAILPPAQQIFSQVGRVLAKHKRTVVIEGHTDSREYSGGGYDNWDLSGARGLALKRVMRSVGVENDQINGVKAMADTRLRKPDDPLNFINRRVAILVPFVAAQNSGKNLPKDMVKLKNSRGLNQPVGVGPDPLPLRNFKAMPMSHPNRHNLGNKK
jgi:chemotaxis protein MotB